MIRSEGSIKLPRAERRSDVMRRSVEEVSSNIWIYNPYIY
jgi:hypothetical protein